MNTATSGSGGLLLEGLDGSNPLAFLAALGTLRTLDLAWPERNVKMHWIEYGAAWRPVVRTEQQVKQDEVIEALHRHGSRPEDLVSYKLVEESEAASPKNKKGEPKWRGRLRFPKKAFRRYCLSLQSDGKNENSRRHEFAAALATTADVETVDKKEVALRTRLDFTAGNQAFLEMIHEVIDSCSSTHLSQALFSQWDYQTGGLSLRWDPLDSSRQYALQAFDPTNSSKNPIRTMLGANRLAIEGLALYPLLPGEKTTYPPGFLRSQSQRFFRWPIWTVSLNTDIVRSILSSGQIMADVPDRALLNEQGISELYESAIVQPSGRYRCFAPAEAL